MGGLVLGALPARAGVDVTVLEAPAEHIGGWAPAVAPIFFAPITSGWRPPRVQ
jgi:hypothetical protein